MLNLYDRAEADCFNAAHDADQWVAEDSANVQPQRALYCVNCGHYLTAPQFAYAVGGKTSHQCTNPAGIEFVLRCFASAPGVELSGSPAVEHSWFPPLAWSMGLCRGCGEHRGWGFSDGHTTVFFALIKAYLREGEAP